MAMATDPPDPPHRKRGLPLDPDLAETLRAAGLDSTRLERRLLRETNRKQAHPPAARTNTQDVVAAMPATKLPVNLQTSLDLAGAEAMRDHHQAQANAWQEQVNRLRQRRADKRAAEDSRETFRQAVSMADNYLILHPKMPAKTAAEIAAGNYLIDEKLILNALAEKGRTIISKAERARAMLEMRANGKTNTEIAAAVGLSVSQVGRILKRELERLRTRLGPRR